MRNIYDDNTFLNLFKGLKEKKTFSFGRDGFLLDQTPRDLRIASASSHLPTSEEFSGAKKSLNYSVIIEYQNPKGIKGIRLGHLFAKEDKKGTEAETIIGDSFDYDVKDVQINVGLKTITLILEQKE